MQFARGAPQVWSTTSGARRD